MGTKILQVLFIVIAIVLVIGLFSYVSAKVMKKPLSLNIFRNKEKVSALASPTPTPSPTPTATPTPSPEGEGKWDVPSDYEAPVVVHVLNGTDDPEVGESMMEKIEREFGYEIGSVGDAPSDEYAETLVMDLKEDDEWKVEDFSRELNADVGDVRVIDKFSTGEFVVIVGMDYQSYLYSLVR